MVRYFQRSVKYFVSLSIIYLLLLYLMSLTSIMVMTPEETLTSLFYSSRGVRMVLAMVALSLAYPWFGFMKKSIGGNLIVNRDAIITTMEIHGFKLAEEREGKMVFMADNFLRRITLLFEDHIVMKQDEGSIALSGNRKSVAYMTFRLEYAIEQASKSHE